jgi:hypothetical protein
MQFLHRSRYKKKEKKNILDQVENEMQSSSIMQYNQIGSKFSQKLNEMKFSRSHKMHHTLII